MSEWHGKTVWLTGASSGIGKALALKLAQLGCTVVISARRKDVLEEIARQSPHKLIPLAVDVSDVEQRSSVQKQLADRVESIDIAIFSAGLAEYEDGLEFDMSQYQRVFAANFFGLVNSVAIALPLLRKSEFKPYIVGLTSLSVLVGFTRAEIYGASKAAADYFLKCLRADLPPEKFDLSIIRPGFVETPMTAINDFPMPFLMTPEQAAERIIKAMKKRKLLVQFPKRLSWLLRSISFFPHVWYRYIASRMSRQRINKELKQL
jgi:short-subunit dehydrogenase